MRRSTLALCLGSSALALLGLVAWWGPRDIGPRGERATAAPSPAVAAAGARANAALAQPARVSGEPALAPELASAAPAAGGERAAVAALPADADASRPFVAGQVVDDAGAPVAGAEVAALISWEDGSEVKLAAASDGAGAFAFDGAWTGATAVHLTASSSERHIDASLEVVPPALDALLVLVRGGWIAGSVLGDELTPPDALRVYLDREPEPVRTDNGEFVLSLGVASRGWFGRRRLQAEIEHGLDTDGSFRVGPLAPGKWRVRIGRPDDRAGLFDAGGVACCARSRCA
jgi:hypothetical protein